MHTRSATALDGAFLERVLLEAYNWSGERFTLDGIRADAVARRYVDGFPGAGDLGIVALDGGRPVGAVWGRALPEFSAGYGFVAAGIPELTLGVLPDVRGKGVGSKLMGEIVMLARESGLPGLSLSVEDGNRARRLYERTGFEVVGRVGGSDTMLLRF